MIPSEPLRSALNELINAFLVEKTSTESTKSPGDMIASPGPLREALNEMIRVFVNEKVSIMSEIEEVVIKRVSAELLGDAAVSSDVLEATLRMSAMRRKDRDQVMFELGLDATNAIIKMYTKETGKFYPSAQDIRVFIAKMNCDQSNTSTNPEPCHPAVNIEESQ